MSDEFHNTMIRYGCKLLYSESEILIALESIKFSDYVDCAQIISKEFGVSYSDMEIKQHDGHIVFNIPVSKCKLFSKDKIFEELHEEDTNSDNVDEDKDKVGIDFEESSDKLTEKMSYEVKDGDLIIRYNYRGVDTNWLRIDMQRVYEIYEELPIESDKDIIWETCKRLGVSISRSAILYLMRFFTKYPMFSCTLKRESSKRSDGSVVLRYVLVKKDVNVNEMRNKMKIERDVIGNKWHPNE